MPTRLGVGDHARSPRAPAADTPPGRRRPLEELRRARASIDHVDAEILALLVERADLARRAAAAKANMGIAILDEQREAESLEERRRWAGARGLDAEAIEEIFRAILRFSRGVQQVDEGR